MTDTQTVAESKRDHPQAAVPRKTAKALNVPLLVGTLVVAAVAGPAAYAWHAFQTRRMMKAFLERADALEKQEDLQGAAAYLRRYVRMCPEDADLAARDDGVPARAEVQVRLAEMVDRSGENPWDAVVLYYKALGQLPHDQATNRRLRVQLAELLLKMRRLAPAEAQARILLGIESPAGISLEEILGGTSDAGLADQTGEDAAKIGERTSDLALERFLDDVENASPAPDPQAMRLLSRALYGQWQSGMLVPRRDGVELTKRLLLATLGLAESEGQVDFSPKQVEAELETPVKTNDGDIDLFAMLAQVYRKGELRDADGKLLDEAGRTQLADMVMDRMVAANPENPQAYLARYEYRTQFELAGAEDDLGEALKFGPGDASVLLAAAQRASHEADRLAAELRKNPDAEIAEARKAELDKAIKLYERAIELSPSSEIAYVGLGDARLSAGDAAGAVDAWKQGLDKCNKESIALNLRLAEVLTEQRQLDEAEESLDALDRVLARIAGTSNRAAQMAVERPYHLLRAKWLLRKGNPAEAISYLKRVTVGQASQPEEVSQNFQAWLLVGEAAGLINQWDRAAAAYEEAAKLQPELIEPLLAAAAAWVAAGQPDNAIRHYERALNLSNSPEIWLALAQARLLQQRSLPGKQHDWRLFDLAVAEAGKPGRTPPLENAWRLELLEIQGLLVRGKNGTQAPTPEEVKRQLGALETEYPESQELLAGLVLIYQQLGYPDEADRALERLVGMAEQPATVQMLQCRLYAAREEYAKAEAVLREGLKTASRGESSALLLGLFQLSMQQGNLEQAKEHLAELHRQQPTSVAIIVQLAEMAFDAGNLQEAESWEEKLGELEGPDGSFWRYFKARRLLAQATGDDGRIIEAAQLQAQIERQRPSWAAACLLRAMILQRQGKTAEAIDAYQRAIALGERRIKVYEQLVALLYRAERFVEAEQHLQQLSNYVPQSPGLSLLEASVAERQGQLDEAVQSARRGADQRPHDLMAWIWLGQLLVAKAQKEEPGSASQTAAHKEAESAFQEAIRLAPADTRGYNGLFTFYVRTGQPDKASETLEDLVEKTDLTDAQREFTRAQGCEQLEEWDEAKAHYREAERLAPESVAIKERLALFLLRTRDVEEAEKTLRRILTLDPKSGAARRTLAAILVERGGEKEWEEALQLLEQSDADQEGSVLDQRIRALSLVRRGGRKNLEEARKLLERLVADPKNSVDGDRLLLGRLYEIEGKLPLARRQYMALVGRSDPDPSHVAMYVDLLLRHELAGEAGSSLDKLEKIAPDDPTTWTLRARWLRAFQRDSEIEPLIDGLATKREEKLAEQPDEKARLYLGAGNAYTALDRHEAAERWYRRIFELSSKNYAPLAVCLAKQDRMAEATELCEQAAKSDESSRPAAVLASVLLSGQPSKEDFHKAEPLLAAALAKHAGEANFLSGLANVRIVQGRIDDAVKLYRQVLELEPRNLVALNNLATLLSEEPDARKEALEYIDRAIEITGPQGPLLDSKGMILLHEGKLAEAVSLLEEAADVTSNDPRVPFHLAVCYYRLGKRDEAREAFAEAVDGGLQDQILMQSDRQFLAELQKNLSE